MNAGQERGAPAQEGRYILRLFISGMTPLSVRAIVNIKRICEEHLQGRHELEVVDLYQLGRFAQEEQIVATPTLIRKSPLPVRRIIGDLSRTGRVLSGLDLEGGQDAG